MHPGFLCSVLDGIEVISFSLLPIPMLSRNDNPSNLSNISTFILLFYESPEIRLTYWPSKPSARSLGHRHR